MDTYSKTNYYSKSEYIKNQTRQLAEERIAFLGGKRLGDVNIAIEDNADVRKIRRLVEKRTAQHLRRNGKTDKQKGNAARFNTRRYTSNQLKNLFGTVPTGFMY